MKNTEVSTPTLTWWSTDFELSMIDQTDPCKNSFLWISTCVALFLGRPAAICLPCAHLFLYLWMAYFLFKIPDPCLLLFYPKWHISLNCPVPLWVSYSMDCWVYICKTHFGHFLLLICLIWIWWLAQLEGHRSGRQKIFFCNPHNSKLSSCFLHKEWFKY